MRCCARWLVVLGLWSALAAFPPQEAGAQSHGAGDPGRPTQREPADVSAIRAQSAAWSDAARAKDLERSMSFFAGSAILFAPNHPPVGGKAGIRKVWSAMLSLPGPGLSFSPLGITVSRSRDLAWEHGTYRFETKDRKGDAKTEIGTYVTIWQKQDDGSWRVVGDFHNLNA